MLEIALVNEYNYEKNSTSLAPLARIHFLFISNYASARTSFFAVFCFITLGGGGCLIQFLQQKKKAVLSK